MSARVLQAQIQDNELADSLGNSKDAPKFTSVAALADGQALAPAKLLSVDRQAEGPAKVLGAEKQAEAPAKVLAQVPSEHAPPAEEGGKVCHLCSFHSLKTVRRGYI